MSLLVNDILSDVSYVLIEPLVNTLLGTMIPGGPGAQTITPGSMAWIYPGALLIVDAGGNQEVIEVLTTTATTFTAVFMNMHSATAPLFAATFPSGQTDAPLFTQQEMIGYLTEVQNDFLLKVRPLYAITNQNTTTNIRYYAQPSTCIRLERIAGPVNLQPPVVITDLYETSQSSLDLSDPNWQSKQGPPQQWFRDQIDTGMFGFYPMPSSIISMELWYSIRGTTSGTMLNALLLVPDIFGHAMKYGVLARAFSKDGEYRDPRRADYCKRRYDMIVFLGIKFMEGAGVNFPQAAAGDPEFSPMPVQQGASR